MKYPVNEYFVTIQGEAEYTGTPSLFVRLQGCPVGCPWCDTKHTWFMNNEVKTVKGKAQDSDAFAMMSAAEIVDALKGSGVKHCVITGGEPAMYDLRELTDLIIEAGCTAQIETSGTFEIKCNPQTWVTLSPKENMPGGRSVLESCVRRANEVKYPVGKQRDVEAAKKYQAFAKVWLQPLSQSRKATEVCFNACVNDNFNLSIQTHKFIGLR